MLSAEYSSGHLHNENDYEVPMYSPNNCRLNRFPVPTPRRRSTVVGCHHGWLVTVEYASSRVHVFNPVTGDRANLPSFPTRVRVKKVALSSIPSSATGNDNIFAAAVYDRYDNVEDKIVFAKIGDVAWSGSITLPFRGWVLDVIYYRGNFFAVSPQGHYQIINPSGPVAVASGLDSLHDGVNICQYLNLALSPSSGHLMLVGRVVWSLSTMIRGYVVRKFNPDVNSSSSRWAEIKDLGDESLFIGGSHAMVLPVGNNSSSRIRRNCIYAIYKNVDSYSSNVVLFDVEKGAFEPSPLLGQQYWERSLFWFLPFLIPQVVNAKVLLPKPRPYDPTSQAPLEWRSECSTLRLQLLEEGIGQQQCSK